MVGAFMGGIASHWFSGRTLLLLFAAMMIVTGLAMFKGRRELTASRDGPVPIFVAALEGLVVGAVTGLVGAGGGFLVVPALVLLGGMAMHKAIGTSLLVITLKSMAAFAGYAAHVSIDFELTAFVTTAAVIGSLIGSHLSKRIPADRLRRIFAAFVIAMAGFVVWQEAGLLPAINMLVVSLGILSWFFIRKERPRCLGLITHKSSLTHSVSETTCHPASNASLNTSYSRPRLGLIASVNARDSIFSNVHQSVYGCA